MAEKSTFDEWFESLEPEENAHIEGEEIKYKENKDGVSKDCNTSTDRI